MKIVNSILRGNTAADYGGGLYTEIDVTIENDGVDIGFEQNSAKDGGGLYLADTNTAEAENIPIGSVVVSDKALDLASTLGYGTWEEILKGRMLVGVNEADADFNTPRKTGGSETVTLTENQMPSHKHPTQGFEKSGTTADANPIGYNSRSRLLKTGDAIDYKKTTCNNTSPINTSTADPNSQLPVGGGQAHTNLQPYVTAYIYRRVS